MKKFREMLRNGEQKVMKVEISLAITFVALLTVLSFIKMILRNVTGQGFQASWAVNFTESVTEWLPHMILLLGFLGASIGITKREVIQMDVLKRLYPKNVRAIVNAAGYLVVSITVALYMYFGIATVHPSLIGPDASQSVSDPSVQNWLMWGYIPTLSLLLLKTILVIFNPQIEQDLNANSELVLDDPHMEEK